jgi:hypothetical protein
MIRTGLAREWRPELRFKVPCHVVVPPVAYVAPFVLQLPPTRMALVLCVVHRIILSALHRRDGLLGFPAAR